MRAVHVRQPWNGYRLDGAGSLSDACSIRPMVEVSFFESGVTAEGMSGQEHDFGGSTEWQ